MSNKENKVNKKLLLSVLSLFFIFFGSFILLQEYRLNSGEEIYLKTIPVDPRDYLRGDYVILSYEIQTDDRVDDIIEEYNLSNGDEIYFILKKNQNNIGLLEGVSISKPNDGSLYIKGRVDSSSESGQGSNIGIHKYFVPEKRGYQVERLRGNISVLVKIDSSGNSIIKDIYYNDSKFEFE